jgi:hypothetical protein
MAATPRGEPGRPGLRAAAFGGPARPLVEDGLELPRISYRRSNGREYAGGVRRCPQRRFVRFYAASSAVSPPSASIR